MRSSLPQQKSHSLANRELVQRKMNTSTPGMMPPNAGIRPIVQRKANKSEVQPIQQQAVSQGVVQRVLEHIPYQNIEPEDTPYRNVDIYGTARGVFGRTTGVSPQLAEFHQSLDHSGEEDHPFLYQPAGPRLGWRAGQLENEFLRRQPSSPIFQDRLARSFPAMALRPLAAGAAGTGGMMYNHRHLPPRAIAGMAAAARRHPLMAGLVGAAGIGTLLSRLGQNR
ncbi:MAG: hypothetical protein AAF587_40515 [Bacteroidota bacterium]